MPAASAAATAPPMTVARREPGTCAATANNATQPAYGGAGATSSPYPADATTTTAATTTGRMRRQASGSPSATTSPRPNRPTQAASRLRLGGTTHPRREGAQQRQPDGDRPVTPGRTRTHAFEGASQSAGCRRPADVGRVPPPAYSPGLTNRPYGTPPPAAAGISGHSPQQGRLPTIRAAAGDQPAGSDLASAARRDRLRRPLGAPSPSPARHHRRSMRHRA